MSYEVIDTGGDGDRTWSVTISAQTLATQLTKEEADALVFALTSDCQAIDLTWISHPHGCFCFLCFAFDYPAVAA